jgi:hypothetical protein
MQNTQQQAQTEKEAPFQETASPGKNNKNVPITESWFIIHVRYSL